MTPSQINDVIMLPPGGHVCAARVRPETLRGSFYSSFRSDAGLYWQEEPLKSAPSCHPLSPVSSHHPPPHSLSLPLPCHALSLSSLNSLPVPFLPPWSIHFLASLCPCLPQSSLIGPPVRIFESVLLIRSGWYRDQGGRRVEDHVDTQR